MWDFFSLNPETLQGVKNFTEKEANDMKSIDEKNHLKTENNGRTIQ